jgi:NAD(P)-dependent dehydrogenase (short-subunit alcohol dehydrogenase family)
LKPLTGKVAAVTGASQGIGRAIAEAFAERGAKVALLSRSMDSLEETAAAIGHGNGRAIALRCDVTARAEVDDAMAQLAGTWGKLDILVNNAGISGRTPIDDPSDERWRLILDTNLTGSYLVTRAGLHLMHSGWGRVINISSVLGRFGVAGYAAYCASKHGVIGLTRVLALELAPRGITVNAICPGWVPTEMAAASMRETAAAEGVPPDAFRERAINEVPLRRFVQPEEVAGLAVYLASPGASAITGQALNICGGESMD